MQLYNSYHFSKSRCGACQTSKVNLGFSLIQLFIGMSISVILLLALIAWYPLVKKAAIQSKLIAHDSELGRVIVQYIMPDIQFSGYRGYRSKDSHYPIRHHYIPFIEPYRYMHWDKNVYGISKDTWMCRKHLPESVCERALESEDILIIYNIPYQVTRLLNDMPDPSAIVTLDIFGSEKPIRQDGMILIFDPFQADLFVANQVDGNLVFHEKSPNTNQTNVFSKAYPKNTEVVELQTVIYYLGLSSDLTLPNNHYALFRDELFHKAEEIITGISHWNIDYGVLKNENPSCNEVNYKTANDMSESDWQQVVSVRIVITTIEDKRWEYEFSIRNGVYFNLHADVANDSFFTSHAFNVG